MKRPIVDLFQPALGALLTIFLGTGCAVSRYQYVSLERVPGIDVEQQATLDLEGLYFSSTVPVQYSLSRQQYLLRFRIPAESYLPAMEIEIESMNGEALSLSHQGWRKVRDNRQAPCGSFQGAQGSEGELHFVWASCADEAASEQYISFDVLGERGQVVGTEDIPFELKTNGIYVLPDLP